MPRDNEINHQITKEFLEMFIPALSPVINQKQCWKFLDLINPILAKKKSQFAYMLYGDGLAVVPVDELIESVKAIRKAEKTHGSSMGWN